MKTFRCVALPATVALMLFAGVAPALFAQPKADSPLGKTNIQALYSEVPLPPATPEEAARRAYGPDLLNPDPEALNRFYQPVLAKAERAEKAIGDYYGGLQAAYKDIAAAYADFYAARKHEINGNPADQMKGTETETAVAQFEAQLIGLSSDLVMQAKAITRDAAVWEKN